MNDPRDYIDKYLIEIENTKDTNSSFFGRNGIENLAANLADLFVAGSETTSTTLTWAVLYMVRNKEIQLKVQKELDSAIGRYRLPSLADKPNLPYTEVCQLSYLFVIQHYVFFFSGSSDGDPKMCQHSTQWSGSLHQERCHSEWPHYTKRYNCSTSQC